MELPKVHIYTLSRFYWEINVSQRIFGTSMMFGVGTRSARLHVDAFVNMLGEDSRSWGLSHKGFLWHAGKQKAYTKPFRYARLRAICKNRPDKYKGL